MFSHEKSPQSIHWLDDFFVCDLSLNVPDVSSSKIGGIPNPVLILTTPPAKMKRSLNQGFYRGLILKLGGRPDDHSGASPRLLLPYWFRQRHRNRRSETCAAAGSETRQWMEERQKHAQRSWVELHHQGAKNGKWQGHLRYKKRMKHPWPEKNKKYRVPKMQWFWWSSSHVWGWKEQIWLKPRRFVVWPLLRMTQEIGRNMSNNVKPIQNHVNVSCWTVGPSNI